MADVDLLAAAIARLDATMLRAALTMPDLHLPTPCADWDLGDLLGHLEAIAGSYVLWVSACVGGRTQRLRSGDDLAAWNATMVLRVPRRELSTARPRWHELASDHLALVRAFPDGHGLQLSNGDHLTFGEHASVAAIEWYLHEWDLTFAIGAHAAPDVTLAAQLVDAWDRHLTGLLGRADGSTDPHDALLLASGRAP